MNSNYYSNSKTLTKKERVFYDKNVAYVEPDGKKIGPYDFRDEIIYELSTRGFYEEEILIVH